MPKVVNAFAGTIGNCFFLLYFRFSCVPVEPVVNASTKNAACVFYNYTAKNGLCKNSISSLYVFGDSATLQNGEIRIKLFVGFFARGLPDQISEQCKPILIDLYCRYYFPPCDTSLARPLARRICRTSCAYMFRGLCEKEVEKFRGFLDENILNCTLFGDTANGGDVPECYQYHTVPGQ